MADTNFWRLPPPNVDLDKEETSKASPPVSGYPESQATAAIVVEAGKVAPAALPEWLVGSTAAGGSTDLDAPFALDEEAIARSSYPVRLASLSGYLQSLRLSTPVADASLQSSRAVPPEDLARCWLASRLAECGASGLGTTLPSRPTLIIGAVEVPGPSPALRSSSSAASWRSLYAGSLVPPDPAICGSLAEVPPLPNPLTITTDVPTLLEKMLRETPPQDWDTKRFLSPTPIEGFPNLCRGPGGLLASHTPRQLAQNLLAAAILNRLCANLLSAAATAEASVTRKPKQSPEEAAVSAAREKVRATTVSKEQAANEEATAKTDLRAFQQDYNSDMERARHLEGMVGWKTSVTAQVAAELAEAKLALEAAEEISKASRLSTKAEAKTWNERWGGPVPEEAAAEQLFGVRLTPKGPMLWEVKDFVQAMQTGLRDPSGGGFVQKHSLEAAFVRNCPDPLLLCLRQADKPEASQEYTHLPTATTFGCGLADSNGGELHTARPQHAFVLRMEGQTFPFAVTFGAIGDQTLAFAGLGADALSYETPWNPLEYGDVLWAQEAQESLGYLPVIAMLVGLVGDQRLSLGVFPPLQATTYEVPLAVVGLALMQAALFNDLKMWPVAISELARLRLEFALRTLRHSLGQCADPHRSDQVDIDSVRGEVLPRFLKVLPKLPNDGGLGDALGSSGGFSYRLKRMEMSELSHSPLSSVCKLREMLAELLELWPQFVEDTSAA